MDVLSLFPDIEVAHIGPPLSKGPLPSVVYFALSARESLTVDPYNQPAVYLANNQIRVFSLDLPAHGKNLKAVDAIRAWAKDFQEGNDPLSPFFECVNFAIQFFLERGWVMREKIGFMGLSRGGLLASLISTQFTPCAILGFAPMTDLTYAKEFENMENGAKKYNLLSYLDPLCEKKIRFYIGNHDLRVGTQKCYTLAWELANAAFAKGVRSPPIELIVSPSIGHMGHGTGKEIFEDGAHWLRKVLGGIS